VIHIDRLGSRCPPLSARSEREKEPLHIGAPGPALDVVFEIGDATRAQEILRRKVEAGEKLMGFGHRVCRVRDPRAEVLADVEEPPAK